MVAQLTHLDPDVVAANLGRVRDQIAAAGRDPGEVEVLAAIKYLPAALLPALAAGGVSIVGENRAQALTEKRQAAGTELFDAWDFIGTLQSNKVKDLLGSVRTIHSLASESALAQLTKHDARGTQVLLEVNVAGDPGKSGVAPDQIDAYLARYPIVGLMTMPPHSADPEQNRRHFAQLAELAAAHGLSQLSMGTSQDYAVAAQEGATIVRLGSTLFTAS